MSRKFLPFLLLLPMGALSAAMQPAQAATFNVTKAADTNDGTCDADCSLREAIAATNANADADTINFSSVFKHRCWAAHN